MGKSSVYITTKEARKLMENSMSWKLSRDKIFKSIQRASKEGMSYTSFVESESVFAYRIIESLEEAGFTVRLLNRNEGEYRVSW